MNNEQWKKRKRRWAEWKAKNPAWVAKKNARKALDKRVEKRIIQAQAKGE